MKTENRKLNRFMQDRLRELLTNFEEATEEYIADSDCKVFVGRLGRILYLVRSYARTFEVTELCNYADMLNLSLGSIYEDNICSNELIELAIEARICLSDMTTLARDNGIDSMSVFRRRVQAIASAINNVCFSGPDHGLVTRQMINTVEIAA